MKKLEISLDFIKQLKQQIVASRYVVSKIANAESLKLYFTIGKIVDEQFEKSNWGAKVLDSISEKLQQELPGLRGFSGKNISKMRTFYKEWKDIIHSSLTSEFRNDENTIWSLLTSKLEKTENFIHETLNNPNTNDKLNSFISISFTHHYEILTKTKNENERWYYIYKTAQNFWSVRHLRTELKNKSYLHEQKIPNNFNNTMTNELSNKAIRAFKDQYLLDFVNIEDNDDEIDERVLEKEIVLNIKKFLMSLGNDFSFMGNQFRIVVEEDEYFIDLLFFHRSLQSLVAFELKKGKFKPEYVGKMNFYLSALDDLVKQTHENPSIGIILCKEKDNKKVEYSFRDFTKPMGVSEFKTTNKLPENINFLYQMPKLLKNFLINA